MSLPWKNRKRRLQDLLNSQGDEQEDGLALDRLLHGHHVIGKTGKSFSNHHLLPPTPAQRERQKSTRIASKTLIFV